MLAGCPWPLSAMPSTWVAAPTNSVKTSRVPCSLSRSSPGILGKVIGAPNQLMVGIEYQYWLNKLGTDEDESAAQFLVVWRL